MQSIGVLSKYGGRRPPTTTFSHKGRREEDEMTAPDLPAELKAALDARLQGRSRGDAGERAAAISQTYRDGGGSGEIGRAHV